MDFEPPRLLRLGDRLVHQRRDRVDAERHDFLALCPGVEIRQTVEVMPDRRRREQAPAPAARGAPGASAARPSCRSRGVAAPRRRTRTRA